MSDELMEYVKKLSFKSMKMYYGFLVTLFLLLLLLLVCQSSGEVLLFTVSISAVYILLIYLIEHSRRKRGRELIKELFNQLSPSQQNDLLKQLKDTSKEQWRSGFVATPEITLYTNGHGVHGILNKNILWAYEKIDIMFPLFRFYSLYLYTRYHQKYICEVGMCPVWSGRKKEDFVINAVWQLRKYYPGIISGYSKELYKLYNNNIGEMEKAYAERADEAQ